MTPAFALRHPLLAAAASIALALPAAAQVNIIFDTDMGPDVDDSSALAMLHTYASLGKANILATVTSNRSVSSALTIDIINTYYNRPDIPVGVNRGPSGPSDPGYATAIAKNYSHLTDLTPDAVPDAVSVYRQALASAADNSVDIVVVGWQSNLRDLLLSPADAISPLNGAELVAAKVRQLTIMGGTDGDGFNIQRDPAAAALVSTHFVTPQPHVWSSGGRFTLVGRPLLSETGDDNPVRATWLEYFRGTQEQWTLYSAYDQLALLYAVEGPTAYRTLERGDVTVTTTAPYTAWTPSDAGGDLRLVVRYDDGLAWHIDQLMIGQAPKPYPTKTAGLVFDYQPAYEPHGYIIDQSGNGFRGVLAGSPSVFEPGAGDDLADPTAAGWRTGGGIRFDSNGAPQYIHVPVSLSAEDGMFSRSFTLEAWATYEDEGNGFAPLFGMSDPTIVNRQPGEGPEVRDAFWLGRSNDNKLSVRAGTLDKSDIDLPALGIDIADGEPHHYAFIYDRQTASVILMVDDRVVWTHDGFIPDSRYLGSLRIANIASNPDAVWNGSIYRVRLTYVPEPSLLVLPAAAMALARRTRSRAQSRGGSIAP